MGSTAGPHGGEALSFVGGGGTPPTSSSHPAADDVLDVNRGERKMPASWLVGGMENTRWIDDYLVPDVSSQRRNPL